MRVTLILGLLAAAVIAVPSGGTSGAKTIRLISIATSHSAKDVAPKGPSAGDTSTDSDRLVNAVAQLGKPKGAVVGKDSGVFTLTSSSAARFDGTARFLGDTLRVRGMVVAIPTGGIRLPVVGGTGRFAGATGTLTVTGPRHSTRALNVYRFVFAPPRA